jgi:hypothetical protein
MTKVSLFSRNTLLGADNSLLSDNINRLKRKLEETERAGEIAHSRYASEYLFRRQETRRYQNEKVAKDRLEDELERLKKKKFRYSITFESTIGEAYNAEEKDKPKGFGHRR